ncbi:GroES-like protein [Amylocystis lapponica]|nr:GroES-like protein [Amylocystis lapponica]
MPPTQQKALLLTSKQGPFEVAPFDVPALGPGQLLVKIQSTALNPVDWKIQAYGLFIDKFPAILGTDAAGTVEAIGEGVSGFVKGDRVLYQGLFVNPQATFQQYGLSNADVTAKIPSQLSFDQAASIPLGLATAALGLYHISPAASAALSPPWEASGRGKYAGKPFAVFGGSSSVGQYVIQLAKLSGFSPIIATASLHNTPLLTSLGATHVLDRNLSADALRAEAAKITSAPIQTVYDAIGDADTQLTAYSLLAPGGTLVIVQGDAIPAEKKSADKLVKNVFGNVNVPANRAVGVGLYSKLTTLLDEGDLKPNVVEVLPDGLGGIAGGLKRLQKGQVSGKKLIARPQETA